MHLDTNIIISNFAEELQNKKLEKNVELYENAMNSSVELKLDLIVFAEVHFLLFKRMYKKIGKEYSSGAGSVQQAFSNNKIVSRFNTFIRTIIILIKKANISILFDESLFLEVLENYGISAYDYAIFFYSSDADILTGDNNFLKFLESNKKLKNDL